MQHVQSCLTSVQVLQCAVLSRACSGPSIYTMRASVQVECELARESTFPHYFQTLPSISTDVLSCAAATASARLIMECLTWNFRMILFI